MASSTRPDVAEDASAQAFAGAGPPARTALLEHLATLPDPRMARTRRHLLLDVLTIALCALIAGGEGWEDMHAFGLAHRAWLHERLGLSLDGGIPSPDTFRRVFARLDPHPFEKVFMAWTAGIHEQTQGEVIALDGKTLRHSFDSAAGMAAIHMVSAWACRARLVLGHKKVDAKTNEITALPELLSLLDVRGCIVTIDAMGCQKEIARQVIEQGGAYVLGLKDNQPTLHQEVLAFFEDALAHDFYAKDQGSLGPLHPRTCQTVEKDHGRIETRRCWLFEGSDIDWLPQKPEWAGLASIAIVQSTRQVGQDASTISRETRCYISSLSGSVQKLANAVRAHWSIENRQHHVLDVSFDEDACPIHKGNAPENLATVRRIAINLVRQETTCKRGIKARRKQAAWDIEYLAAILAS